ncbi:MAG: lamin tail domain-containing protein [Planctomycetota bacterium]
MFQFQCAPAAGTAAALLLLAGSASAQFELSGSGCAGESGTVASIEGKGFPTVGLSYSIEVSGAPDTPGLLGIGLIPIGGTGFDLSGVGLPGCTLDTLIVSSVPIVTDPTGLAVIPAPAPTVPGDVFYLQGYLIDAGPSTLGATTELLKVTTIPPSGFAGGEIIVTEFMRDTSVISDNDGEWIEVFNTTATDIDIEGWVLADDDSNFHVIDKGGQGVVVEAGGFGLLCVSNDALANGGLTPDYAWGTGNYQLSNTTAATGDEIVLLDFSGLEIDRLMYSNPAGWPLAGAASASLDPGSFDATANDDPANWCVNSTDLYDTTAMVNTGTPDGANPACPPPTDPTEKGDVIFVELMNDTTTISDLDGEYAELLNTTDAAIDIEGWVLSDLGTDSHTIDVGGAGLVIPAGGRVVLCRNGDSLVNGGITADYVYSSWTLGNSGDEAVLTDDTGQKQDEVVWDTTSWPEDAGDSMSFNPAVSQDEIANNDPANWCNSTSLYDATAGENLGTPGVANDPCP